MLVMRPPVPLITERLTLRPPALDDADAFFESYSQDPEVTRYLTWRPHAGIDHTVAFIERCLASWEDGTAYPYAITETESGRVLGVIEARLRGHQVELGYVLAQESWGTGFATEAVSAIKDWALSEPEIWRVWAYVDVDNIASGRVLQKAGLEPEGVLRRFAVHPNVSDEPRDCWVFAATR
jgi:RimJ/RimL family protein N-acetyltransferase